MANTWHLHEDATSAAMKKPLAGWHNLSEIAK